MKPGETITPGGVAKTGDTKPAKQNQPTPKAEHQPAKKSEKAQPAKDQAAPWQYQGDDADDTQNTAAAAKPTQYVQPISWTASEYVSHQKGFGWFVLVLLVIVGLAAFVYVITDDMVSPIVILITGLAFMVFAGRPPQTLEYSIDGAGVHIGPKAFPYNRFRSFSILADEPIPTIMFTPIRRFDLPITIHFDPADAEEIIGTLGNYLPGEEREAPPVDRFMSKIRF